MQQDGVFVMQCIVTLIMMGISTALIFFPPNDASFTIGIAMLSSITGYWFPNPNRKQKTEVNGSTGNGGNTGSNGDGSSETTDSKKDSNIFSSALSMLSGNTDTADDGKSDNHEDVETGNVDNSVYVPDEDDSGPRRRIGGLNRSVRDTVAKIDATNGSYIRVEGGKSVRFSDSDTERKTNRNSFNDDHIAI